MDQAAKLRELLEVKVGSNIFRVITVSSGKGGVGKSNFVVNLALSLTQKGKRVAILDADFGMANVDILLGVKSPYNISDILLGVKSPYNISDILLRGKSILDIIVETKEGIKIIPGGSGISKLSNLSKEEEDIVIAEFDKLTDIDILIIDTGAGIGNNVINFIKMADDVIIITNSEPTSITDAYGLIKVAEAKGLKDKLSVVINRTHDSKEADETFNKLFVTAKKFIGVNLNYLGYVLEDSNVSKSVKKQEPFLRLYPNCSASMSIEFISGKLIGDVDIYKNKSIKGYISRFFGLIRG